MMNRFTSHSSRGPEDQDQLAHFRKGPSCCISIAIDGRTKQLMYLKEKWEPSSSFYQDSAPCITALIHLFLWPTHLLKAPPLNPAASGISYQHRNFREHIQPKPLRNIPSNLASNSWFPYGTFQTAMQHSRKQKLSTISFKYIPNCILI